MADTTNTAEILIVADASGVEAGLRRATTAADRAEQQMTAGARNSARSQASLVAAIQRTTAQMETGGRAGSRYFEILAQQRGVDPRALEPYLRQLRAVEQAQQRAGQSAAQTSNAMRQLPAQMTDVLTSLQGGQNPLTVLMQQGGQVSDSFGGIGAAIRGVGGHLLGMINPVTVATAVVAGLGYAYYAGSQEARAFNLSIATTGNAAGTSAALMAEAAAQTAEFIGSQNNAAEVLAAMVSTGQISGAAMVDLSVAAIKAQRDLGREVSVTVDEFAALGKDPVKALADLIGKYHHLSAATYAQVKALQDEGRTVEAVTLAQKAHADGINSQSSRVVENLGYIESAWRGISKGVSEAAGSVKDWFLSIGRDNTMADLTAQAARIQKNIDDASARNDTWGARKQQALLDVINGQIAAMQEKLGLSKQEAEAEARNARAAQLRIEITNGMDKLLSREELRTRALAAARVKAAENGLNEVETRNLLAVTAKEYSDVEEAAQKKREAAAKAAADARKKEAALLAELAGVNADYMEQLSRLQKLRAAGNVDEARYIELVTELIAKQPGAKRMIDERNKAQAESDKLYEQGIKTAEQYRDTLLTQVAAQRESNDVIGLTSDAAADLQIRRLEDAAALKEQTVAALDAVEPGTQVAQLYREQAAALRDLASAKSEGARKQIAADSAKQAADDWKRASEDINRSLTDALLRGFESGKSFGKNLVDTLKNMFSTLVLRPVIQGVVSPMANQITAAMQGYGGSGAGGALGNAMNLYSAGKSIFSGFSSGLSASMGGLVSQFGSMFGSSAISAFGTGMSTPGAAAVMAELSSGVAGGTVGAGQAASAAAGASAGAYAIPIAGWIAAGMMASNSMYKQGWDMYNGTVKDPLKLGGGIKAFDGLLRGIGLSNTAANIFSGQATFARLFGRKNPEIETQGIRGTFGGAGFDGLAYANILEKGGVFRSDKRYEKTAALSSEQDASFDATFKGLMDAAKGFASTLGIEASVIEGYNKQIKLELGKDEAKNQEAIAALFGEIGDELSVRLVPSISSFTQAGETASATLQRLVTDYATVDEALTAIGIQFGAVGVASLGARERLIEASGGLEAFAANTAGFQQNFLTEAERNAPVLKAVTEQLAALGLAGVDTRDEFKQVVLGLDLTTEAGAKQYGALMKMQAAFAQVYPALDATADAAAKLAEANKPYLDQIAELERSLMSAADQRAADIAGMDASTVALYDHVAALRLEVEARDQAAERAQQVAAEARSLQDQYDQLTMSRAQLLEKERNALDPANRALFDQIKAIEATREAMEKASQSSAEAVSRLQAQRDAEAAAAKAHQDSIANTIEKSREAARALRDFGESLKLGDLSPLSKEAQYSFAKQQLQAANPENMQAAANAFLKAAKDRDAGGLAYAQDFAMVQQLIQGMSILQDLRADTVQSTGSLYGRSRLGLDGSHANGLDYVPFDGYRAELHRGERVQTAAEARGADATAAAVERLAGIVERQGVTLERTSRDTKRLADGLEILSDGFDKLRTTANV